MAARLPGRAAGLLLVVLLTGCDAGHAGPRPAASAAAPTAVPVTAPTALPSAVPTSAPVVTTMPTAAVPPSARPTSKRPAVVSWSTRRVTAADLPHSWHPGCPVGPSQLRLLTVPYVGFDGARHTGELVVAAQVVPAVAQVFTRLYAQRFPIRSMHPVDSFGGSDDASMAADNTSGFNCRDAVGGSGWSMHAYGLAIDVDPRENPYLEGGRVRPPEGAAYVDRSSPRPGMVVAGGPVVRAFTSVGWGWGGAWRSSRDYQHFSSNGK